MINSVSGANLTPMSGGQQTDPPKIKSGGQQTDPPKLMSGGQQTDPPKPMIVSPETSINLTA